jgi:hypothetical protein
LNLKTLLEKHDSNFHCTLALGTFFKDSSMAKRSFIVIVTGLYMLLTIVPLRAQETLWTAWLYNPANGNMTLLDDRGAVLDGFILPLPKGYDFYPFEVGVAHDGTRVSYVAMASQSGARQVRVVDTNKHELIADYELTTGGGVGFIAEEGNHFNESGTALAFAYSQKQGGWQIAILDIQSGLVTLSLRSASPAVTVATLPVDAGITPIVQRYSRGKVMFTLVQIGAAEGPLERGSYTWDAVANTIRADSMYTSLDYDVFEPTGEVIMSAFEGNLPNQNDRFRSRQMNVLVVYDAVIRGPYPFYNTATISLYQPRFIQNGERILVGNFDAQGKSGWLVIERDGTLVGEWQSAPGVVVSSIQGSADGFLYTGDTVNPGSGHTTLFTVNTRDGLASSDTIVETGTPLWSSDADNYPRLVWLNDTRLNNEGEYRAWGRVE